MKIYKKTFVLIFVLILCSFAAQIQVNIENIQNDSGTLFVGLFKADTGFAKKENRIKGGPVEIINRSASTIYTDIPAGQYAVSTHHDVNSNGKIDKNLMGLPKEPYGFSNNKYGPFGKPDYKKATITVSDSDSLIISIKLR